jgi:hypothetical protein
MRATKTKDGLTVYAVAGTNVVILGMNMDGDQAADLMGFAIQRKDHKDGKTRWLEGLKRFDGVDTDIPKGKPVSTRDHPVQSFQWADYTVKEGRTYTYKVIALRGDPGALTEDETVSVKVTVEEQDVGTHRVFFNRGAASSQAYEHEFDGKTPDEVGERAYTWLSRGLFEAFQRFVGKAKSSSYGLRAALYECHEPEILAPLGVAFEDGADVQIVYDGRKAELAKKNKKALKDAGLASVSRPRTSNKSDIAHNKFIVLLKDGKPIEVWTGSMNLSINGVWGQSNVGHWVKDAKVARDYLAYWERLQGDPKSPALKTANFEASDLGDQAMPGGTTSLFSPRPTEGLLETIGEQIVQGHATFITLPFGIVNQLAPSLLTDDGRLRCILLDSKGSGANHRENLRICRNRRNVIAAVGNRIVTNALDEWVQEQANPWSTNVEYVHTKYALIDPLSDDPIVITGSANFSGPSITGNDENILVIRGDTRVADIYLGEFRRLFDHHAFRESLTFKKKKKAKKPGTLEKVPATWLARHFDAGGPGDLRRGYFSGVR